ncbi:MAG TPA: YoaK family protein [Aldersonia sp.]
MPRPTPASLALAATIALTFVTGVVDAVGFLGLDRVFTGNMTGNIVILGMGVAGADELPVLGPAIALAAFTFGAFAAGMYLRTKPSAPGWHDRITILLLVGAAVLAGLTVTAVVVGETPSAAVQVMMAAATAAVMGEQALVARALAVKDMTTVVVTSTLTSLAGETWVAGGRGTVFNRRAGAIMTIFLGAIVGALLLRVHLAVPFALATAATLLVVILGHLRLRPAVPAAVDAPALTDARGR